MENKIINAIKGYDVLDISQTDIEYIRNIITNNRLDVDTAVERWLALNSEYTLKMMNDVNETVPIVKKIKTIKWVDPEEIMKMDE